MPVRVATIAALSTVVLIGTTSVSTVRAGTGGTLYALSTPPSALEVGCQGPCVCAIQFRPTFGSFRLVPTGSDPLYTYYSIENYIASYNNGPGAVSITGSGRYKVGGEFAQAQQMSLDLAIEGRPVEHFDSGLVPVGAAFPQIDIACAVHGFYCFDTVLVVDSKPIDVAAVPTPSTPSTGLGTLRPNPFEHGIRITFVTDRPQTVDLLVVDLEGRRVRALATGPVAGPGQRVVTWDGLRDDGRVAPSGVYWVLMRWSGGSDRRRVVKLD